MKSVFLPVLLAFLLTSSFQAQDKPAAISGELELLAVPINQRAKHEGPQIEDEQSGSLTVTGHKLLTKHFGITGYSRLFIDNDGNDRVRRNEFMGGGFFWSHNFQVDFLIGVATTKQLMFGGNIIAFAEKRPVEIFGEHLSKKDHHESETYVKGVAKTWGPLWTRLELLKINGKASRYRLGPELRIPIGDSEHRNIFFNPFAQRNSNHWVAGAQAGVRF